MQLVEQTIHLQSSEEFGTRLPPEHLGHLFVELPQAIRQSVAMATQNRSSLKGPKPKWLTRAGDIRFVDHTNDDGIALKFEAARLGDSAPELFQQQSLFPEMLPDPDATGFDLFGTVLRDIASGEDDSAHFDTALLRRVERFRKVFRRSPFTGIQFSNRHESSEKPIELNQSLVDSAKGMLGRTPQSQRVRLVGELDGIEASTQRFSLMLDSGDKVSGVFVDGQMDVMQSLWRQRVLVLGSAIYRASGRLLRIEADEVQQGDSEPSLFSRLPTARHDKLDSAKLKQRQGRRSGMAAIAGAWPGDETDEQIEAALEQLS